MNLWFRLIWLLATSWRRPHLTLPQDMSSLDFRVWPHDLDISLHMNNGRYWSLMDLGRADLMLRSGLWRDVLKHGWTPVVNAATIRFRRELRLAQAFRLETRILCWAETWLVMEHRVVTAGQDGQDIVAAVALVRAGIYDRRSRGYVATQRLMEALGTSSVSPDIAPDVAAFLASEDAMKKAV